MDLNEKTISLKRINNDEFKICNVKVGKDCYAEGCRAFAKSDYYLSINCDSNKDIVYTVVEGSLTYNDGDKLISPWDHDCGVRIYQNDSKYYIIGEGDVRDATVNGHGIIAKRNSKVFFFVHNEKFYARSSNLIHVRDKTYEGICSIPKNE